MPIRHPLRGVVIRASTVLVLAATAISIGTASRASATPPDYSFGVSAAIGYLPTAVVVNPASHRVYTLSLLMYPLYDVGNQGATTSPLVVIDESTEDTVATISVPRQSTDLAVDTSLDQIYVGSPDGIQVVEGATNALAATIAVPADGGLAVNASTHTIYAASGTTLRVVNGTTNSVTASVSLSQPAASVAVNTTTGDVFVGEFSGTAGGSVEIFSGSSNTRIGGVAVGDGPPFLAVDEAVDKIYAATGSVCASIIDGVTHALAGCLPIAVEPNVGAVGVREVAVSQSTGTVFLATTDNSSELFSGDAASSTVAYLTTTGYARGMIVDQSTGKLFVASQSDYDDLGTVNTLWSQPLPQPPKTSSTVYRFWSPTMRVHFYTISAVEKQQILADYPASVWTYEGSAYEAFVDQQAGTIPLYRFWSPTLHDHFYTASAAERDSIIRNYDTATWTFEGTAFYVYPLRTSLPAVSVARFWSPDLHNHFYTASGSERDEIIADYPSHVWSFEDNEFSVPVSAP